MRASADESAEAAVVAPKGKTAIDVFRGRVEASRSMVALRHKEAGSWKALTWGDWDRASDEIAAGLIEGGTEHGDRVALLANTRYEWLYCDVGVMKAAAAVVPIYPSSTAEQCAYIVANAGARVIIVEDPLQLEKLLEPDFAEALAGVREIIYISDRADLESPRSGGSTVLRLDDLGDLAAAGRDARITSMSSLRSRGADWLATHPAALAELADGLDPSERATIVYTSGTTGPPKGVVLTHKNIAFECAAVEKLLQLTEKDEQLLFLPLAHIFARVLAWAGVSVGFQTAIAESVPQLVANLGEVKPTFMGGVPRVYEKAYARIQARFADKRQKAVGRLLIDWALAKGRERSARLRAGSSADSLGIRLADRLVFEKVRATFGGRLRYFVSGGAPLSAEIAEFFHAAGILVLEGYGLTEVTAASHVNRPDNYDFGTVGPPLPGVDVKIAADGEILLRGANLMEGYYEDPEATAEVIDDDGWFHTGDIGSIGAGGRLRITDRKKDIIVTAGGKNVAPQNLENAFKTLSPLVSQMMVYGDKRKYLSALITLNEENLVDWAAKRGIAGDYRTLTQNPQVFKEVEGLVKKLNADLASYETIKKFQILERDFDQEHGELTPSLKVKRKICSQTYEDILHGFYGDEQPAAGR